MSAKKHLRKAKKKVRKQDLVVKPEIVDAEPQGMRIDHHPTHQGSTIVGRETDIRVSAESTNNGRPVRGSAHRRKRERSQSSDPEVSELHTELEIHFEEYEMSRAPGS